MASPDQLVVVAGTGTGVGKTWVAAAVAQRVRGRGRTIAARKPVQSFDTSDAPATRDAAVLAAATGVHPDEVCAPHRSYEIAMAPPMAAHELGRPRIMLRHLLEELRWPPSVDLGLVETAGGVRSPIADDGDTVDFVRALRPSLVVLVADAGLGTINAVRLAADALCGASLLIVLNRFDDTLDLHQRNRTWLSDRYGLRVGVGVEDVIDALL